MPTVLRFEGYRFYFYSHEPGEPPHVHVDKGDGTAKIWLDTCAVVRDKDLKPREIARIVAIVHEHRTMLLEAWNGYFGNRR
jgi:hypothetical protein